MSAVVQVEMGADEDIDVIGDACRDKRDARLRSSPDRPVAPLELPAYPRVAHYRSGYACHRQSRRDSSPRRTPAVHRAWVWSLPALTQQVEPPWSRVVPCHTSLQAESTTSPFHADSALESRGATSPRYEADAVILSVSEESFNGKILHVVQDDGKGVPTGEMVKQGNETAGQLREKDAGSPEHDTPEPQPASAGFVA
jgi:hypothetical protein